MTNWAQRQREIERARAQAAREYQRQVREQERYLRQQQRERAFEEKERRRLYVEGRVAEADELNEDLATTVAGLRGILAATLGIDDHIDFESLKERPRPRELELGALAFPAPSPEYTEPPAPTGLRSLVPGAKAKHAQAVDEARRAHAAAMADWERHEERRVTQVRERQEQHEAATNDLLEQAHVHNEAVDRFKAAFDNYEPDAVVNYFSLVLAASGYPEGFPKQYKVAFVPESKQLVVEYDLPDFTVVPEVREYHYVKAKDEIAERTRPMTERKALYAGLVAQTALRTIHELFEADRGRFVETVVYNGYVDSIDRRTGHAARPCGAVPLSPSSAWATKAERLATVRP